MRARLLDATLTSIANDGAAAASVERITERAGVSRGMVRHHYGSKSRLLAAAFQRLADDYRGMLGIGGHAHRLAGASPRLRLADAIVQAFEQIMGLRERQFAWLGFWALARSDSQIERINHQLYEEIADHLGTLIAAAASEHGRDIDAAAAGRGLAAMIEGAWLHATIGVGGMSLAEAERLCLEYAARLLEMESLDGAADEHRGA